jgi:hypothetical protein
MKDGMEKQNKCNLQTNKMCAKIKSLLQVDELRGMSKNLLTFFTVVLYVMI